jgi:hypothetical protein
MLAMLVSVWGSASGKVPGVFFRLFNAFSAAELVS